MKGLLLLSVFLWGVFGYVPIDFSSTPYRITPAAGGAGSGFGAYMDGAAVDKDNNVYAVNYGTNTDRGTIGRFFPNGTSELWFTSTGAATFTSLKFDAMGNLYVGDVQNKRVLRITSSKSVSTFCGDPTMLDGVPGDMSLAANGNLFITGNNIPTDSGEIWLCNSNGTASKLKGNLHRTNGIELSPNDRILYVTESTSANGTSVDNVIRAYDVDSTGQLSNERIFFNFTARVVGGGGFDSDGLTVDIDGTLYISRSAGGILALIAATGGPLFNIGVSFTNPATVTLGGASGTTVFIIGKCGTGAAAFNSTTGCVDTYNGSKPGREWSLARGALPTNTPVPTPSSSQRNSQSASIPNPTVPNSASSLFATVFLVAVLVMFSL